MPDNHKNKFEKQIQYLHKKFSLVSSLYLTERDNFFKSILITFDDGIVSVLNNALPVLSKYKIPSIIFFPAGYLGQLPGWETMDNKIDYTDRIMNENELKFLIEKYDVEIGSHTVTHKDLKKISADDAIKELIDSRLLLEKLIDREVNSFSFPYGSYNHELVTFAINAGYKRIFNSKPEIINLPSKKNCFGRISVNTEDSFIEFKLKVNGGYSWLPFASRVKNKIKKSKIN